MNPSNCVIPTLRYRDAHAAIAWFKAVFGFVDRLVVPNETGGVQHAQLTLGGGMIMLGTANPEQLRLRGMQADAGAPSCYLMVRDVDATHARALAHGGREITAPEDQHYGGRLSLVADPEGYLWAVGSYDPWVELA